MLFSTQSLQTSQIRKLTDFFRFTSYWKSYIPERSEKLLLELTVKLGCSAAASQNAVLSATFQNNICMFFI